MVMIEFCKTYCRSNVDHHVMVCSTCVYVYLDHFYEHAPGAKVWMEGVNIH